MFANVPPARRAAPHGREIAAMLEAVAEIAMSFKPEERFRDAKAFTDAIEAYRAIRDAETNRSRTPVLTFRAWRRP